MAEKWIPTKPNFGPPPSGYIAGLGRGATGFVTRSDLGPAAKANNVVQIKASEAEQATYADNKYDSWQGYKGALFTKQHLDDQDRQADLAFDFIEKRMEERRLKQKSKMEQLQVQKQKKQKKTVNNTPISQQFTDLKRQLSKVTEEEWANLPQSLDLSIKKRKREKYTPVPDAMIVNYLSSNVNKTEVQSIGQSNQNFRQAKEILLKSNLEKAENEIGSKQQFDKIGYLTHLDVSKIDQQLLGDIKRARLLHKAALASNPKNADIWLSAARIEQIDGKVQECRSILHKALEHCPQNQDIWIQLSRVERADQSKNVLIQALRQLPKSEKIWLTVARKQQQNKQMKSKVLRKGLENIPQSTKLWKELIQLSDIEQAKNLLYKAVECLPKQIDLWIGLAKLQTYQNAKQVLNKARKANPLNLAIWISAAKLQQTQSENHDKTVAKIETIVTKGREILKKNGNAISREELLQEALICERSSNLLTCESIVKSVITLGLTEDQLNHSIFKDVQLFEKEYDSTHATRFLYKYGILQTQNPRLLQKMLDFEERLAISDIKNLHEKQKKSQIMQSLTFGLKVFPTYVDFWLTMIDRLIDGKNYSQAEAVIQSALQKLSIEGTEKLLLKKVQIYKRQLFRGQARALLGELRQKFPNSQLSATQSVWFEYHMEDYEAAWKICLELFKKDNKTQEIWELALRIKKQIGTYEEVKNIAEKAISQHPKSVKIWKMYIKLELSNRFETRARTIVDRALMKNPKNEDLYLTLIQLEISVGNAKQISTTIAKALKQCPKSGQIWGIAIIKQPHNTRKKKASIAIQNCGNHSAINLSVAKLFWKQSKSDKARRWLEDAIQSDRMNGDLWAYYYKLIKEYFSPELQKVELQFLEIGKITHGRRWMRVKEESSYGWRLNEKELLQKLVEEIGDEIYRIQ